MIDPHFSSEHEQNAPTLQELIPEGLSEEDKERLHSAMASVSDTETDITEDIFAIVEEAMLAMKKGRKMPRITQEDVLCTVMAVLRPTLKQMTFDEREQVCDEVAENVRKARFVTDAKIRIVREDRQEPEDPRELGRRIMAERNTNYREPV